MSASHRIGKRVRNGIEWLAMCLSVSGFLSGAAFGGVIFDASGTAASGRLVTVRATLTISGDGLAVDLENISPANTAEASEVLTSFYFDIVKFDIVKGAARPALSLASAAGFVWLVRDGKSDIEYQYVPQTFTQVAGLQSELKATNRGDASWQFRVMDAKSEPLLAFGIGTVGNTVLAPNGFTPSIVGPSGNAMLDFGIFRGGDLDPKGVLANRYLVKNRATFLFTGLDGYDESDIVGRAVFGLGSSPDSVLVAVPEPATILLTLAGVASAAAACRRRPPRRQPGSGRP